MSVRDPLPLLDVENLLAARGADVRYETVRFWWNRLGPVFASEIRRKRVDRMGAYTHWRWRLDEAYVPASRCCVQRRRRCGYRARASKA